MNTVTFSNAASAVLDVFGDGSVFAQNSVTSLVFNDGTLRKMGGVGTVSTTVLFRNSGMVQVNIGTMSFGAYSQIGGQTIMNGGNFAFSPMVQLRGGSLSGNGTIIGSVSNNAIVSLGVSLGLMTITNS